MRRLLLVTVVCVAVIGLIGFVAYRLLVFQLIGTFPKNHAQNMPIYQSISFSFSQKLATDSGDNTISITPAVSGKTQITGKTVTFTPSSPLTDGQSYTVTLANISNGGTTELAPISITFKAIYVPFSSLPASVQQRYVGQQDQQYDAQTGLNKLKNGLPHQTALYTLSYSSGDNTFVVATQTADVAGDEAAANSYIEAFGVNPTSLTIYDSVPAVYSGQPGP